MILIVAGSRNWTARALLFGVLDDVHSDSDKDLGGIEVMFNGDCATGADRMCREWAHHNGVQSIFFPAVWSRATRNAGPVRNSLMVDIAYSLRATYIVRALVFAQPCNKPTCKRSNPHWTHGTQDCVDKINKRNIKGKIIETAV